APPAAAAPPAPAAAKPAQGFRMLKLHGGEWTEYEFVDGKQIPVVKSTSGTADTSGSSTEDAPAAEQTPYSYLNGSESPFYEPAKGSTGSSGSKTPATTSEDAIPGIEK
ncbi:MAG: hypothetical protein ACO1RT_12360, partial [Planctomycetaceae bacterium]